MLLRFDPFRELDRLAQGLGTGARASVMPIDAYRQGDQLEIHFDLPGVDPASIDLTVERNVLTVSASRSWEPAEGDQVLASERLHGTFSRQLFLGDGLDADHIEARYENGVLTVTAPLAESERPRRVEIATGGGGPAIEQSTAA